MSRTKTEGKVNSLEATFSGILEEYGTSVPQFSVVIAVIIGSLGFDKYFNAGIWTIIAILCFSLVYLFRRQIGSDLRKTGIFVLVVVLLFLIPGVVVGLISKNFKLLLQENVVIGTVYSSALITIPLAMLISSYRKQERAYGLTYPNSLNNAIDNQLMKAQFYRNNIKYEIIFINRDDESVTLETRMSYDVTNRGSEAHVYSAVVRTDDPTAKPIDFSFDDERIYISDPRYRTAYGFKVPRTIPGGKTISVYSYDQSKYRLNDSELYTTYDPATDLTLQVRNLVKNLIISFEPHYDRNNSKIDPKEEGDYLVVRMPDGLLPYQGVRMNWKNKGGHDG